MMNFGSKKNTTMVLTTPALMAAVVAIIFLPTPSHGHGIVSEPGSRNWYCGFKTKPHETIAGGGEYPECGAAFDSIPGTSGYQFMSVLTHDLGRQARLSTNVCGFDSETWLGGATPWDATGVDWPTTSVTGGERRKIEWDISWGPHFDDTLEFVHYVTKPDFVYDKNTPLKWSDFEDEPFCLLGYNDANPTANPDVIPLEANATFETYCTLPERAGRHIIYAEWGRNQHTNERFHSCIDVEFPTGPVAPTTPSPTEAPITPSPTEAPITPSPVAPPTTPSPIEPTTPQPINEGNPGSIPYPCCGWGGSCQQPDNTWCHSTCDRCTGACNGVYYLEDGSSASKGQCDGSTPPPPTPSPVVPPISPSPIEQPTTPSPIEPTTPQPINEGNPGSIPYPCCGWGGSCQQPDNTWCHSTCDRCTGACNGVYYLEDGSSASKGQCDGTTPPPDDDDAGGVECCTWGGWSDCPAWTQTSNNSCQQSSTNCAGCSGTWISGRRLVGNDNDDSKSSMETKKDSGIRTMALRGGAISSNAILVSSTGSDKRK
mmetsp:Transcript_3674/g.5391  ORF Transcript_3674/g.5391 Transcript_3674/m.5391 type:complete len:542 (-) Transcript_3674:212-1837(-)